MFVVQALKATGRGISTVWNSFWDGCYTLVEYVGRAVVLLMLVTAVVYCFGELFIYLGVLPDHGLTRVEFIRRVIDFFLGPIFKLIYEG